MLDKAGKQLLSGGGAVCSVPKCCLCCRGNPGLFLQAHECLTSLFIVFPFIMLCNLPALPSSCPSGTASHPSGGRGALDRSPETCSPAPVPISLEHSPPAQRFPQHREVRAHSPQLRVLSGSSLSFPSASRKRWLRLTVFSCL